MSCAQCLTNALDYKARTQQSQLQEEKLVVRDSFALRLKKLVLWDMQKFPILCNNQGVNARG